MQIRCLLIANFRSLSVFFTYMLNKPVLEFLPAFLTVDCVLIENSQSLQACAVRVAQSVEVDEFFTQEEFQQLPKNILRNCGQSH